ncbi:MAG: hypothetical protein RIK87_21550 [Fuerstiella sp.]
MHRRSVVFRFVILLCLCTGFSPPQCIAESENETMRKIFAAWETRQKIGSRVHYELRCQRITPKGFLNEAIGKPAAEYGPLPPEDVVCDQIQRLWLDFAGNRSRFERDGEGLHEGEVTQKFVVSLCDGRHLQTLTPRNRNRSPELPADTPIVELYNRAPERRFRLMFFSKECRPVFWTHGVFWTNKAEIAPLPRLQQPVDRPYFRFDREITIGARNLIVLRTANQHPTVPAFSEYWIDPEMDAAVVRYVRMVNEAIESETDIEYQETPHGWLPARWTESNEGGSGIIDVVEVVACKIEPDFANVVFHVDPAPGTIYWNETNDETLVAAEPGEPDMPYEYAQLLTEEHQRQMFWWWVVGIALLSAIGILGWRKFKTEN